MLVLGQDGCLFWDKMDFCPGTRWIFALRQDGCSSYQLQCCLTQAVLDGLCSLSFILNFLSYESPENIL